MKTTHVFLLALFLLSCNSEALDNKIKDLVKEEKVLKEMDDISEFLNTNNIRYDTMSDETINKINESRGTGEYIIKYKGASFGVETSIDNDNINLFLIRDTVFQKNLNGSISKFSGKIRVIGNMTYVDETLNEKINENATLGLFTVKNGIFDGNQLYYLNGANHYNSGLYLMCNITPFLDVVLGEHYIRVYNPEEANILVGGVDYYRILDFKQLEFPMTQYWNNGKLFYTRIYNYNSEDFINAALSSGREYQKFTISDTSTLKLYHYNGNLAFEGKLDSDNFTGVGKYYTFNKIETDRKHFMLQTSYSKESYFNQIPQLDAYYYKCFRRFFGDPPSLK